MKKLFSAFLTMLLVVGSFAVSCTKDDTSSSSTISVSLSEAAATSATFSFNASSATEYAYKVYKSGESVATNGLVLFTDADETFTVDDSNSSSCTVYGLEGSTSYTVAFAFKRANGNYTVQSVDVTTVDYDDEKMIYIISAERNTVKFHFNMPEGTKYRYALVDRSSYELYKLEYGYNDMLYLEFGTKAEGPLTVTVNDNDITGYDDDGTAQIQYVKPGMSFVVMLVECDENYNALCEYSEVTSAPAASTSAVSTRAVEPNTDVYSEKCGDDVLNMTGLYAKQTFTTRVPLEAEGDVGISITTTERTASISITPTSEVLRIGYAVWETAMLEYLESLVGTDGLVTAAQNDLVSATEAVEYEESISPNTPYTLMVIYISDEEELTRSVKLVEFTALESELPEVVLEITACDASYTSGGYINPYKVAFNIKAPNQDCTRLSMVMDYSRVFYPEINAMTGATQEDNITSLILTYGTEYTSAYDLAMFNAINSDEGYSMEFDSEEDTESILAILSFNADEKTYLAKGTSMSAVEPAKETLTTDFFSDIDGYWTATYNYYSEYSGVEYNDEFTMLVTDDPLFGAPETFDSSHADYSQLYNYYVGRGITLGYTTDAAKEYATTQIQTDFNDFLTVGKHFQEKYKAQNRKVIFGFELDAASGGLLTNHSPWDLFCDLDHATYDVEQIFHDYGPKIFIEVVQNEAGENEIVMNSDYSMVPPFFSYYGVEFGFGGLSTTAWENFQEDYTEQTALIAEECALPIIIHDEDKFEIGCYTDAFGVDDYIPTVYYNMYGMLCSAAIGLETITITRSSTDDLANLAPAIDASTSSFFEGKTVPTHVGNQFKRLRYPFSE